jgi:hypothetical protein
MALPLVAVFWSTFVSIAIPLAIRVLAAIGLGVVAYSGISALMDSLFDFVQTNIGNLGSDILQYVAVFNVDRFFTMIFSAFTIRLVFLGMSSAGVITRMQWRAPTGA